MLLWTEPVKADTALMEIALDSTLWRLPEGVSWTAASGRAKVRASVKRSLDGGVPTLLIESACDSLERLCALYEAENERLSVANSHLSNSVRTADEQREGVVWQIVTGLVFGMGAGILLTTILTRKIYGSIRRN